MTVIRGDQVEMQPLAGRRSGDPLAGLDTASSVRIVELSPGETRTAHVHPHSEEITIVVRGRATIWIGGTATEVSAGDVAVIPPDTPHATVADEPVLLHCFFPHPDLSSNYCETDITIDQDGIVSRDRTSE